MNICIYHIFIIFPHHKRHSEVRGISRTPQTCQQLISFLSHPCKQFLSSEPHASATLVDKNILSHIKPQTHGTPDAFFWNGSLFQHLIERPYISKAQVHVVSAKLILQIAVPSSCLKKCVLLWVEPQQKSQETLERTLFGKVVSWAFRIQNQTLNGTVRSKSPTWMFCT